VRYPAALVVSIFLLLALVMRRHMTLVMVAVVSLLALMELGALGMVMIWPTVMAVGLARRSNPATTTTRTDWR
jgi:hypothetical protein